MGQISLKTTESGGLWPSSDGRFSVIHSNFASKSNKSWRFQPRLRIRRRCHKSILYDSKASWQLDYDVDYSATERAGRTRVIGLGEGFSTIVAKFGGGGRETPAATPNYPQRIKYWGKVILYSKIAKSKED